MKNTSYKTVEMAKISWELNDFGVLTISGNGRMPDYACGKNPAAPWEKMRDSIEGLVIEEGITEIGINAFRECRNLKKAVIANSVHHIHAYAFRNCVSLKHMDSGSRKWRYVYDEARYSEEDSIIFSVETFLNVPWAESFWKGFYCNQDALFVCFASRDTLIVPEGIRVLKSLSFSCINAKKIILPETLKVIESFAFSHVDVDGQLRIPDGIQSIDRYAFSDGKYHSISFPEDWRPDKHCWIRTRAEMRNRKSFPKETSKYSIRQVPRESIGRFHRLKIVEKKAVHHKNGQITEVVDKPVCIADRLLRRLYAGQILIGVRYENDRVSSVLAYLWEPEIELINVYEMHPVITDDGNVEIWSDSFSWKTEFDIECTFPGYADADLIQTGGLRFLSYEIYEEWFWTKADADLGDFLEITFLKEWLIKHPEIKIDSMDECIKKPSIFLTV